MRRKLSRNNKQQPSSPTATGGGSPRGECPPRWRRNTNKYQEKKMASPEIHKPSSSSSSSSKRREEFVRGLKQAVDFSFYMTISSISSLGDESITSEYDDDESDIDSTLFLTMIQQDELVDHEEPGGYKDLPPLSSFRSTRTADRWEMVPSQDSIPPSPARRSFELPKSPTRMAALTRSVSHGCSDTMPRMPRRGEHQVDDP